MQTNPKDAAPHLLTNAKLCGAKNRAGKPCRAPAETGKARCRFHGARAGAPRGKANGSYRHGGETKEARSLRAEARRLLKELRDA
ncbi:HGGxSTG domain-containing protein [Parasphingorhabdus sp.]|uniref:HGGxSTG domain-containing protein n=1 Tax=Parasphingorhabdus sp. TaxID=2709688 RepID=UPI003FA7E92C